MKGYYVLLHHEQRTVELQRSCCQQPHHVCEHAVTWVEISTSALMYNIAHYKAIVGSVVLAPVIKGNAYGHGMEHVAQICQNMHEVGMLCVVRLTEAIQLRRAGITKPLLVLSIIDADLLFAGLYDIDIVLFDIQTAQKVEAVGKELGKKIRVHIKVDTGLSRLGLVIEHALTFVIATSFFEHIFIAGIFTHFAESEKADQAFTDYQLTYFNTLIKQLEKKEIYIPLKHSSCSAAITANKNCHFTMVRTGIGMYGLWPSSDNVYLTQKEYPTFHLKPVMTWKTKIIQIKKIPAGSSVGYDRTHLVDKDTTIAILPTGYWDGYDRRFSNTGCVIVNDQKALVIGRVAMNMTMIDVSTIADAHVGNEVILLGDYDGVRADDLAQLAGTINYEIVTRINPAIVRITI